MKKIFFKALSLCIALCGISSCSYIHNSDDVAKIAQLDSMRRADSARIAALEEGSNRVGQRLAEAADNNEITVIGDGETGGVAFDQYIDALDAALQSSKQEVAKLKDQLNRSKGANSKLKALIEKMEKDIATKESAIAELKNRVANDSTQIAGMQNIIAEMDGQIADMTSQIREANVEIEGLINDANEAYYVIGTRKDLEAKGIVEKAKGITRTRIWTGNTNKSLYTKVDKREFEQLKLNSKDAKFISSQTKASYSLDADAQGMLTLNVKDKEAFWAQGAFLIIITD